MITGQASDLWTDHVADLVRGPGTPAGSDLVRHGLALEYVDQMKGER